MNETINWADFTKIEMRVGTITEITDFPEAKNPSYKIWVDFGPELGVKKTSAQITLRYTPEQLVGKQVVAVVNFPKKQIANFMSECLILGAVDGSDVVLLQPESKVINGLKIS
ncbi:tRNA-binding protein [Arenibacter latericius]|uniref:tRNA-binding protein n=1 Tax=Arenibacter latericius TaxID=86104 RepID=UPI0003F6D5BE|nr:tRNA-binding protein [Arenibacter latericius]MDX1365291.1 tRNA-binding protein [Arenibacter latericius]